MNEIEKERSELTEQIEHKCDKCRENRRLGKLDTCQKHWELHWFIMGKEEALKLAEEHHQKEINGMHDGFMEEITRLKAEKEELLRDIEHLTKQEKIVYTENEELKQERKAMIAKIEELKNKWEFEDTLENSLWEQGWQCALKNVEKELKKPSLREDKEASKS